MICPWIILILGAGHLGPAACGVAGTVGHLLLRALRVADHGGAGGSGTFHGAADAGSKGTRPGRGDFLGHDGQLGASRFQCEIEAAKKEEFETF